MHYGGDYNPEQWPESVWPEDVALMREAGVTMVSIGIFSWSRLQPAEGVFDFGWLDRVIDLLHEGGIAVDLATATASPPPWMHESYPEILPRRDDGVVLGPGSRQHYAPSSPVYRRLAKELVTALAERYANHPAVVMWHINNEYGCHLHADYSEAAAEHFRRWLEARYGSVDALNAAWATDFWSQRYTAFSQVLPPRTAPYSHNPGQLLDFRRFTSDTLLECYLMEKQILIDAGVTVPITTNFMGTFPAADYFAWAPHVDVVSDDCYPDPNDPESFRTAAFARDLMRSLKPGTPWLLMEQASNALNWRPTNAPKAPGQMAALSMQAVGRGADGILFFQWRQGRAGAEKFHSAMLPQAGTRTRTWREIVDLGAQLAALPALPAPTSSRIAVVFDWQVLWAMQSPDHPIVLDYTALVTAWHAALHELHVQADVVTPASDLSGYDAVIAPQLYLLDDVGAANLTAFVQRGGHLLVGAFSDVVDEHDAFRLGGYLTQLAAILGIWLEDFGALQFPGAGPGQAVAPVGLGDVSFDGGLLAEEIHLDGAEQLGTFVGGRRDGDPAVTRLRHGTGSAWYVATIPDHAGLLALSEALLAEAGIAPVIAGLPPAVELSERGDLLTLINHGADTATIPAGLADYATGAAIATELAPFAVAHVRRPE
jgi:beta-galactosidase